MRTQLFYAMFAFLFLGLFFQSCSSDELSDSTTDEFRNGNNGNRPGGNNNNNNGNNNNNANSVSNINRSILTDWTDLFLELDQHAFGMRPNATARALAYINLAAYETAIPGMRNHSSTQEILEGLQINSDNLSKRLDFRIALNTCYADVMDHFLINLPAEQRVKISELEESLEDQYTSNGPNGSNSESREWGAYVAQQIIEYSQTDTEAESQILQPQPTSYEPPVGDGFWTYSADQERALFPYWSSVRTFVIAPEETTTVTPISYSTSTSSPYYAQMREVMEVNNEAREEQNDQLWIAEFWSDDVEGLMLSPPGRQFSIANQLIDKYKLNLEQSLALFVKLGFSLNDGAVSTWKYKYEYMVMRPTEYIHEFIDPEYQTNLYKFIYWPNPSFPGYPSGHSCFASAAAGVFIDYFGNEVQFTDRTHEGRTEFLGNPRSFSTLRDLAEENAFSRIPLGVHVRMDCEEGLRLGYEIADAINNLDLDKDPT